MFILLIHKNLLASMKSKLIHQKGFTLVELLVVISIIGMLSSIVLSRVFLTQRKARDQQRKEVMSNMNIVLELYRDKYGSYPNNSQSRWGILPASGSGNLGLHPLTGSNGYIPNIAPEFMVTAPYDILTGKDNFTVWPGCSGSFTEYLYIGDGKDYKLEAFCLAETVPSPTDQFYDPSFPDHTWQISTPGAYHW
jgi:prepilin-type N-terminal cleavage/methylation domain-containing protein